MEREVEVNLLELATEVTLVSTGKLGEVELYNSLFNICQTLDLQGDDESILDDRQLFVLASISIIGDGSMEEIQAWQAYFVKTLMMYGYGDLVNELNFL